MLADHLYGTGVYRSLGAKTARALIKLPHFNHVVFPGLSPVLNAVVKKTERDSEGLRHDRSVLTLANFMHVECGHQI